LLEKRNKNRKIVNEKMKGNSLLMLKTYWIGTIKTGVAL
jgi:hypothetical protein